MKKFTKHHFFGMIIGFCLSVILITTPILASGGVTSLQVVLNNVNILLDGTGVASENENFILSNGSSVPNSILYKGTTYLPVRKLSELLGKEVGYIAESKTVVLGAMPVAHQAGWVLADKKFVPSGTDYDLHGFSVSYTMSGQKLDDKTTAKGEEGSYIISVSRQSGGKILYASSAQIDFSAPPSVIIPGVPFSMFVSHKQISEDSWGTRKAGISFSSVEAMGFGTSSDIKFKDVNGTTSFLNASGTVTPTEPVSAGKPGDIYYLKVGLGGGYGYVYTYEWKE